MDKVLGLLELATPKSTLLHPSGQFKNFDMHVLHNNNVGGAEYILGSKDAMNYAVSISYPFGGNVRMGGGVWSLVKVIPLDIKRMWNVT